MFSRIKNATAVAIAASLAISAMPITEVYAHDRHNPEKHGYSYQNWHKHNHRKFHRHYGRGEHGVYNYHNQYNGHRHHKKRKSSRGDLIAAGVIGLAIGAIIASEASKNKAHRRHVEPQPTYDPHGNTSNRRGPITLDEYNNTNNGEPDVITFRDTVSLEPWTQGWYDYCTQRYRSFNAQTGTFRGYDGRDHFCVPKN